MEKLTEIPNTGKVLPDKTIRSAIKKTNEEKTPEQARMRTMQEMEAKFDGFFLDWQKQEKLKKAEKKKKVDLSSQPEKKNDEEGSEENSINKDPEAGVSGKKRSGFSKKIQDFREKLNDLADVKWLRKKGVENPEQVVAFRNWCVENIPYTQWKCNLEKGRKKLEEDREYRKSIRNIVEKDGKIYFKSRHNVGDRYDLERYAKLFEINHQADKVIEELNNQKLLSEYNFTLKDEYLPSQEKDYLKQILEDPEILNKLKIFKKVDLSKIPIMHRLSVVGELLENKEFLQFIQNLRDENEEDENTKKEMIDLIGKCSNNIDLEDLVEIITDEEKRKLAKQVKRRILEERGKENFYNLQYTDLIKNFLINEENLKILKQVLKLDDIVDFKILDWEFPKYENYEEIEESIEEKTQGIKLEEIINDSERIQWLKRFCGLLGRKLNLEEVGYIIRKKEERSTIREEKKNKYFWSSLGAFLEIGLLDQNRDIKKNESYDQTRSIKDFFNKFEEFNKTALGYSHTGNYSGPEKKAENQEGIFDAGFIDFAKKFIKKTRIEANINFLPFLHEIYKSENSEKFLTQESIAVQAYLKFKVEIGWKDIVNDFFQKDYFLEIITISGMLETLKNFDNFFNYDYIDSIHNNLIAWHKENDKGRRRKFVDFLEQNQLIKKGEKLDLKYFNFLLEFFNFSKKNPESDFSGLKDGLDNDLCYFMNSQKDKVFALSEEKRRKIFGIWKKVNSWNMSRNLKYKVFGLILEAENPSGIFEELEEILSDEGAKRLFEKNNLVYFDKILGIERSERNDYLEKMKKVYSWDIVKNLEEKIFNLILEAENPSGIFEELEEILGDENAKRLFEQNDLVYFDKILGIERGKRSDYLEKMKKVTSLKLSNKEIEKQLFIDILDSKVQNLDDFIEEVEARQNGIKGMLETAKDFSKIIDNDFSGLLNGKEQESGLDLNEKQEIVSALNEFMNKNYFREKGRTILTLMVAKESKEILSIGETPEIWKILKGIKETIKRYENIIQKGSSNNIPLGIRASIGMEYEVTNTQEKSVGKGYFAKNYSDYRSDIRNLSKCSKIGQGAYIYYEIAFQPTDNPFLVILELKLLQDLEFIDLNFSEYSQASRGYHITLGGEIGMKPETHTYFLQSMLSCANFLGINAGESVTNSKGIHEKGNDSNHNPLFDEERTPMAEFKSFSCDKFEMFERAILTSHNATIAIQAVNKFTTIDSFEKINQLKNNFPQNSELFYSQLKSDNLLKEEIKDSRIKEIIFSWFQLQVESLNLIEDHNQNFLENETRGYFDEETGEYIDVRDFSPRKNKAEFENYLTRVNKIRQEKNRETFHSLDDYFEKELKVDPKAIFQELNSDLINTFTAINNLSLKSGEASKNQKGETEFDRANVGSIMHTRIGHKKEYLEGYDDKPEEKSIFDRDGKIRKGYYYFQGFSERMITHKIQTLLLNFNEKMDKIINQKKESKKDSSNIEADDYTFAA